MTVDQLALEVGGFPTALRPMQPETAEAPFDDPFYFFEVKWDGARALLHVTPEGEVRLHDRGLNDLTYLFPEFGTVASRLPAGTILDGSLVVTGESGKPDREALRLRLEGPASGDQQAAAFLAFDILWLEGKPLTRQPLARRKKHLHRVVEPSRHLFAPKHLDTEGVELFEVCLEQGLEGVIAKHRDSLYVPGQRSPFWLSVPAAKADSFVVLGWVGGQAATFSALLVGYYEGGALHPCGTVGGGFDAASRAVLSSRLALLATDSNPIGPVVMEAPVRWIRPELVVTIKYSEWAPDGTLRFPIFDRVRGDMHPTECVRHRPRVVIPGRVPAGKIPSYLSQFPF